MVWKNLIIPGAALACLLWSGCDSQTGDSMVYPEIGVTFVEMKTFGIGSASKTDIASRFSPNTTWEVQLEVANSDAPNTPLMTETKIGDDTATNEVTFSFGLAPDEDYIFRVSFVERGSQEPSAQGSAEFYIDESVAVVDIPVVVAPASQDDGGIAFLPGNVRSKVGSTISVDLMYFGANLMSSGIAIEFEPQGIPAADLVPLFDSEGNGFEVSYDDNGTEKLGLAWIWASGSIGNRKLATLNIPTTSALTFSLKVADGDVQVTDNRWGISTIRSPETAISVQVIQ